LREVKLDITIRKAVASDIEILNRFLSELFTIEDNFTIDLAKQRTALEMITGDGTGRVIFVAETGSLIAGMINLQKIVSTASGGYSVLLEDLYIVSEFRGKGIGKKLFDQAVRWGREQHALRIQLAADIRNKPAMDFYSGMGCKMSSMICYYKYI
jgi:GNAT superfamily N-acetyltransferase